MKGEISALFYFDSTNVISTLFIYDAIRNTIGIDIILGKRHRDASLVFKQKMIYNNKQVMALFA